MSGSRNQDAARAAWGAATPDWIDVLATACDATSQTAVAQRLGISGSAVNAALRNRYPAETVRIEQRVRGVLMRATVACPVLGELASDLCLEWQGKAETFQDTGQLRRRMFAACRRCARSRFPKETVNGQ
ncbi:hypothetical protein [Elioraea sp.]|uniref:hypothetical protein n=1 Tax=Elioraea sp. TaxID=2185103 RepID=UPI0025BBE518|nr:hypothetical protein [Elioraea sp.]